MIAENFKFSLDRLIVGPASIEGGYVDNPADRGGPTNMGITLRLLEQFLFKPCTPADLKALTPERAAEIYRKFFWDPMHLDGVKSQHMAAILFDQAVNRGVPAASRALQDVLNASFGAGLKVDAVIGAATVEAVNRADQWRVAIEYIKAAQKYYVRVVKADHSQLVFLEGWLARTWRLLDLLG